MLSEETSENVATVQFNSWYVEADPWIPHFTDDNLFHLKGQLNTLNNRS